MADINSRIKIVRHAASKERRAGSQDAPIAGDGDGDGGGGGGGDAPANAKSCGPDNEMVSYAELLFFAYRDFTTDADVILLEYGFGRAHHRVLHFVSRNPGLRVADLLEILKITKQSLARVLKQLVDEEIITQKAGAQDRRERRLYPTKSGQALVRRLSDLQCRRINQALAEAGPDAETVVKKFLFAMIKRADRGKVDEYFNRSDRTGGAQSPEEAPLSEGTDDATNILRHKDS